jgi:hypothetical protein
MLGLAAEVEREVLRDTAAPSRQTGDTKTY